MVTTNKFDKFPDAWEDFLGAATRVNDLSGLVDALKVGAAPRSNDTAVFSKLSRCTKAAAHKARLLGVPEPTTGEFWSDGTGLWKLTIKGHGGYVALQSTSIHATTLRARAWEVFTDPGREGAVLPMTYAARPYFPV